MAVFSPYKITDIASFCFCPHYAEKQTNKQIDNNTEPINLSTYASGICYINISKSDLVKKITKPHSVGIVIFMTVVVKVFTHIAIRKIYGMQSKYVQGVKRKTTLL